MHREPLLSHSSGPQQQQYSWSASRDCRSSAPFKSHQLEIQPPGGENSIKLVTVSKASMAAPPLKPIPREHTQGDSPSLPSGRTRLK